MQTASDDSFTAQLLQAHHHAPFSPIIMNQTEPLSQAGDPTLDMSEPLRVMTMEEEVPTMEGRSNLRVFLVMMALAVRTSRRPRPVGPPPLTMASSSYSAPPWTAPSSLLCCPPFRQICTRRRATSGSGARTCLATQRRQPSGPTCPIFGAASPSSCRRWSSSLEALSSARRPSTCLC